MSESVMGNYSPESVREISPDTMSSIYPDRPIRPLPKRRLRERLSPDVAETIKYPPAPSTTTPLFYYPYSLAREDDRSRDQQYPVDRQRSEEAEHNYISRRSVQNVQDVDSDEDYTELAYRSRYSRHSPDTTGRSYRYVQKPEASKYSKSEPPPSATSSVDGYESFENTNNKKKRKIPTPGDAGLNGIHLSNDLASLGISTAAEETLAREDIANGSGQHYASSGSVMSANGQGISGPGRGRYGRVRSGRSPLQTLSDSPNTWVSNRTAKARQTPWPSTESAGIISTAIANAEKLPVTPPRGQENVSLLQQQASKKSSPASTQFTFTCDSQVPGIVAWPGPPASTATIHQSPALRGMSTHATQTSPKVPVISGQANHELRAAQPSNSQRPNGRQALPTKKTRRRTGKEYIIAARQRREQQEYQNYHHPPAPEDEWICEFCEYERIFGTPPEALIKQYEIKDRRVRKQEAERRRLLEKAKMKGRKGKKGGKLAPKNVTASHDRQGQTKAPQQAPSTYHSQSQSQSQGTQSEEYYEDEYDEDYTHDEPLPSPTVPSRKGEGEHSPLTKQSFVQGGFGMSESLVS